MKESTLSEWKKTLPLLLSILLIYVTIACSKSPVEITGEFKKWHTITLLCQGPETSELSEINPFLDYRLEAIFQQGSTEYIVPGFYAADGNAAESSASSGNIWKVHFTPDRTGDWNYVIRFKKGKNIAISDERNKVQSAGYMDGIKGSFAIEATDKAYPDFRSKGRLNYVDEPYLQFAEDSSYFIKLGVDAPENLLAYSDIDATPNVFDLRKEWSPHEMDFQEDATDLIWQGNKGRQLFGAIHYLASEKLNVFSFLTFNIDGDDRNVYPFLLKVPVDEYEVYANVKKNKEAWINYFHRTRLDISKLEQWDRIFTYGERKGMFLHFKTHETETDHLMDNGNFGIEGKLYYRELIARFGHHLALNWNLGEENNQPIEHLKEVADYVKAIDPYQHHRVVHTFPNQDYRYGALIGDQSALTGASLQLREADFSDVHDRVLKWKMKSDSTGKHWALSVDEPGKANIALLPDDEDPEHDLARSNALWGALMAGAYGVEWYFGYDSPNSDLTCEDFRSRDLFWDQNRYALQFFERHIPFWQMEPHDELIIDEKSYCLAKPGEVYVIYQQPSASDTRLDLRNVSGKFTIDWYDPRNGGEIRKGSLVTIDGGNIQDIGEAPDQPLKDWVILVQLQ